MNMVKRVADAIADSWVDEPDGKEMLTIARAAIAAMQNPTPEMMNAMKDALEIYDEYASDVWHAGIDAALEEPQE